VLQPKPFGLGENGNQSHTVFLKIDFIQKGMSQSRTFLDDMQLV
jgi:hypothetical protein